MAKKYLNNEVLVSKVDKTVSKISEEITNSNEVLEGKVQEDWLKIDLLNESKVSIDQQISKVRNQIVEKSREIESNEKLMESLNNVIQ
ncbi:hypothetical protein [Staphylococcus equorum]|uniref:Uncharacterized protein n=1 Tax=Staphylococcus equorum TaxID=246432 RepID=A0A9X4LHY0_9STAP|nr:hypothetical protein [Staphylococcus equorum]MDG0860393.1 hypothetical protein [Staphylococcus equorum]